jgi:radical SAM protein with 4Fe4S-binding SPASM domain
MSLSERLFERTVALRVPLSLHVDLTMRCNERCVHCYRVVEPRPELTTDELRALLDDAARAGALYLTLGGGEVFLRRDLMALVEHAKRRRFDVRLKSNALLVDDAVAARLRALGVRQVDVSLYSADPARHDRITGVPGSLARTLDGVRRLVAAGVTAKLTTPLMAVNSGEVAAIRALAAALGARCGFDPMITARNDGDRAPVALRIGPRALARVLADPAFRTDAPPAGTPPDPDELPCGASHNACHVNAYGDVSPCVAMPVVCGNVRETPFAEIWHRSARMREVRAIRRRDLAVCAACEAAPFCSRCPGQALVEDGDLRGPSTAACEQALVAAQVAGSAAVPAGLVVIPVARIARPVGAAGAVATTDTAC